MISLLVLMLSISISIIDLRTHRIPNVLVGLLAIVLLADLKSGNPWHILLTVMLSFIATISLRFGMGDFKLWLVLLISQSSIVLSYLYCTLVLLASVAAILLSLMRGKRLTGSMPFAPVILLPFTALYLAI